MGHHRSRHARRDSNKTRATLEYVKLPTVVHLEAQPSVEGSSRPDADPVGWRQQRMKRKKKKAFLREGQRPHPVTEERNNLPPLMFSVC